MFCGLPYSTKRKYFAFSDVKCVTSLRSEHVCGDGGVPSRILSLVWNEWLIWSSAHFKQSKLPPISKVYPGGGVRVAPSLRVAVRGAVNGEEK